MVIIITANAVPDIAANAAEDVLVAANPANVAEGVLVAEDVVPDAANAAEDVALKGAAPDAVKPQNTPTAVRRN